MHGSANVFLVPLVEDAGPASRPDGSDVLRVGWVAFSSHDETGDDLRRRCDDPDITWVDHTHPVVYAGAGSHSGAYLPGIRGARGTAGAAAFFRGHQ